MEKIRYKWAIAFLIALIGALMSITPIIVIFCGKNIARVDIALTVGAFGWFYALSITMKQLGRYL